MRNRLWLLQRARAQRFLLLWGIIECQPRGRWWVLLTAIEDGNEGAKAQIKADIEADAKKWRSEGGHSE